MTAKCCLECGKEFYRPWAKMCQPCGAAKERAATKRRAKSQPIAVAARRKVSIAVKKGLLPHLRHVEIPCVDCGATARCYDHRDYSKPLEVDPVCVACNRLRGPGLNAA